MEKGVFVYGYYGVGNLGDELLALSTFQGFAGRFEKFYFRSYGEMDTISEFDNTTATNIERDFVESRSWKSIRLTRYLRAHWQVFKSCSRFVFGGGTTISGRQSYVTLFLTNSVLRLAKLRGLKTHAIGLGVLDSDRWFKRMFLKRILSKIDSIRARDAQSLDILNKYRHPNASLTTDLVFSMKIDRNTTPPRDKVVILTIASLTVNSRNIKNDVTEKYLEVIRHLIQSGYRVKLVAFQVLPSGRFDDEQFFEEVITQLKSDAEFANDRVELVSPNASNVHTVFESASLVIGHRFHSLVLAAIHHIPFIGFFHEHKVTEVCDVFGMPYYPIDKIDVPELKSNVAELGSRDAEQDGSNSPKDTVQYDDILSDLKQRSKLNFKIS